MPKINIKATIKGREGSIVSEVVGTLEKGILKLREKLGNDFVYIIGNDMKYLNEIIKD